MAAETVAWLVLLFDFLVLALKSDELTCCATVKLNEQTTQCSKKKKRGKGGGSRTRSSNGSSSS